MSTRSLSCILKYGRSGLFRANGQAGQCGALVTKLHKVNLTSTHGEPDPNRAKPWPYERRPFGMYWQFFDSTLKRVGENSKVIVVDGNLAVGKSEFAEKIAKEFDLKYFPDIRVDELFEIVEGFDIRELDEQLPENLRTCDLEKFYSTKDPKKALNIANTQLMLYFKRMMHYVRALEHVLNTGQGVVVERSVFSDIVYADTLKKYGYISKPAYEYYRLIRDNSICELWKPHVFIYLDAPVSHIRDRIKKRAVPYEVQSPVLTDDYLSTVENMYKKQLIPELTHSCEVIKYDVTDLPQWDMIVEDLETLDLDTPHDDNEEMFKGWYSMREEDWNKYRMLLSSKWQWNNLLSKPLPWDAPELCITGDDIRTFHNIVNEHPAVKYSKGYDPEKYSTLLKW
ncbi:hypothetical protein ScPMuIL_016047 [Solemya velum]